MLAHNYDDLKVDDLCVVDYTQGETPRAWPTTKVPTHKVVKIAEPASWWFVVLEELPVVKMSKKDLVLLCLITLLVATLCLCELVEAIVKTCQL